MSWNMVNVGALILFKGHWVDLHSIIRSFLPFVVVVSIGVLVVGWPFLLGLLSFSLLLMGVVSLGYVPCQKSIGVLDALFNRWLLNASKSKHVDVE